MPFNTISKLESNYVPEPMSGCWIWMGPINDSGYGIVHFQKKHIRAHRFFYERAKGEIEDGLVLDHKCRVRCCVNPDHLEPVTIGENVNRGIRNLSGLSLGKSASLKAALARTHCKNGHEFSGYNLSFTKKGTRVCKTCHRNKMRKVYALRRALGGYNPIPR